MIKNKQHYVSILFVFNTCQKDVIDKAKYTYKDSMLLTYTNDLIIQDLTYTEDGRINELVLE